MLSPVGAARSVAGLCRGRRSRDDTASNLGVASGPAFEETDQMIAARAAAGTKTFIVVMGGGLKYPLSSQQGLRVDARLAAPQKRLRRYARRRHAHRLDADTHFCGEHHEKPSRPVQQQSGNRIPLEPERSRDRRSGDVRGRRCPHRAPGHGRLLLSSRPRRRRPRPYGRRHRVRDRAVPVKRSGRSKATAAGSARATSAAARRLPPFQSESRW